MRQTKPMGGPEMDGLGNFMLWAVGAVFAVFCFCSLVYVTVKLGTIAFFSGRDQAKKMIEENRDDGDEKTKE